MFRNSISGKGIPCLICCSKTKHMSLDSDKDNLSKQLNVIFILSKLLDIPSSRLECYLKECGNPETWMIKLCSQCSQLVAQARELQNLIVESNREINKIKLHFVEKIKETDDRNNKDAEDNLRYALRRMRRQVWEETREFVKNNVYDRFTNGDRLARDKYNASYNDKAGNDFEDDFVSSDSAEELSADGSDLEISGTQLGGDETEEWDGHGDGDEIDTSNDDCLFSGTRNKSDGTDGLDKLARKKRKYRRASNLPVEKRRRRASPNQSGNDKTEKEEWEPEGSAGSESEDNYSGDDWLPPKPRYGEDGNTGNLQPLDDLYAEVGLFEMPEFKREVVRRILKGARMRALNPREDVHPELEEILLKYNAEQDKLHVANVQVLVNEQDECLECSQCSFKAYHEKLSAGINVAMEDHIGWMHLHAFTCAICGKEKKSHVYYRRHMRNHKNIYECDICGRPILNPGDVKSHKWSHLSKKEKEEAIANGERGSKVDKVEETGHFQCAVCGKEFSLKRSLKSHEEVHKDKPMTICSLCGKAFPCTSFGQHEKRCIAKHEGAPATVKCVECDKTFLLLSDMKMHLRNYHRAKPREPSHLCPVCGKGLHTQLKLDRHMLSHSDATPFPCPNGCQKRFKSKIYANRHSRKSKICKAGTGDFPETKTESEQNQ